MGISVVRDTIYSYMDEIIVDGKKYISARRASGITAYTQDYVGQLCRSKKVTATQISRNWYVEESSLLEYKEFNSNNVDKKVIATHIDGSWHVGENTLDLRKESVFSHNEIVQPKKGLNEEAIEENAKEKEAHTPNETRTPSLREGQAIPIHILDTKEEMSVPHKNDVVEIYNDFASYTFDNGALLPKLNKSHPILLDTIPEFGERKVTASPVLNLNYKDKQVRARTSILRSVFYKRTLMFFVIFSIVFMGVFTFNSSFVVTILENSSTRIGNVLSTRLPASAVTRGIINPFYTLAYNMAIFIDDSMYDYLYSSVLEE